MKYFKLCAILISTWAGFAGFANAQMEPQTAYSDTEGNTALGAAALPSPVDTDCTGACGIDNTAAGNSALHSNTTGSYNIAIGEGALVSNTTGSYNTASGTDALYANTTGSYNVAIGVETLEYNSTGSYNTASSTFALFSNTTGTYNVASGYETLEHNSTGSYNTADGVFALSNNTSGNYNTAFGAGALYSTTGSYNSASGYQALHDDTTGAQNTASGVNALYGNTKGDFNTASGVDALIHNTTGSSNIAEGYKAGYNLTTGSNNIDIGSPGVVAESGVIRIGTITGTTSTQNATYIAGIYAETATGGTEVFIDSSGRLGTKLSSLRYKEDVEPMAEASERLLQLRPVKFRYKKADASGAKPIQYGLIAEEVAKVYPELVVRDATTGRIDGVRYDELAPMLLNEMKVQKQQFTAEIQELRAEVRALQDSRRD
jgi:trimeric autotransporter adhesin